MNTTPRTHDLLKLKFSRKKTDTNSWALSYGDIVTVLLCFFIIFYALEKQIEKKIVIENKIALLSNQVVEHKATGLDAQFNYAIESLEKIDGLEIKKTSDFVDINFRKTVFFNKGKSSLTPEGKIELERVVEKLVQLEGKYTLEIQGHADSSQVKNQKDRWWHNNMQLSVLRALDVHSFLAANYMNKDYLIVSGHGSRDSVSEKNNDDHFNRKISLRLQLVK
jgi:chemotaxis protein MotB